MASHPPAKDTPLAKLHPAPWNPRSISDPRFAELKASIERDPDFLRVRPVLAMADGTIYAGNMRYRAAEALGWKTIPAIVADIPELLAKERALRDNNSWGEWEDDQLGELLRAINEGGGQVDMVGFEDDTLRRLINLEQHFNGPGGGNPDADPEAVPDVPKVAVTQPGQLFRLGNHRLLCGDSTASADVAGLMADDKAVACWTDPPYGVSYVGKTNDALTIKGDDADGVSQLITRAFALADQFLAPGSPVYCARPPGAHSLIFTRAFIDTGWRFHEELVWVKDTMVLGHSDYHLKHETIMFGYTKGPGRAGRGAKGWYGDDSQVSVFEIPRPKASPDHPTGKPVALVAAHLANSSAPGDIVYEPFCGSGTTLIAAEELGRRCYAMEIDPAYCDVIIRRWETYTGQAAERIDA